MWEYNFVSHVQLCSVYIVTCKNNFSLFVNNNTQSLYYKYIAYLLDIRPDSKILIYFTLQQTSQGILSCGWEIKCFGLVMFNLYYNIQG